jgi:hypothetical protein
VPDTPETPGAPGDAAALRAENGRLREANERLRMLLEDKDAQIAELAERVARLERLISRNSGFSELRVRGRFDGLAASSVGRRS